MTWLTRILLPALLLVTGISVAANDRRHEVDALKYSALQTLRDLLADDLAANYPEPTRVSVYLDVAVGKFLIQRASVYVDGDKTASHDFSERQALALLEGGLERVLRVSLPPGTHRLRLEYAGYLQGFDPQNTPLSGDIELNFESKPKAQAFILPAAPQALRPARTLTKKPKREKWDWRSEAEDPRLERVRYLRNSGDNFAGLLELLEVAGPVDDPAKLPRGYQGLLALSLLDFGLRNRALQAARLAWEEDVESSDLVRAWLGIADLDYRRGHYGKADQLLRTGAALQQSDAQKLAWQDLHSRILLALDKPGQAADILAAANRALDEISDNLEFPYARTLHLRYNYAVALIESDELAAGRTLLDRIGRENGNGKVANPLRDQANLALGYHFLRNDQGASAKALFQRVPLSGPYSNRALLGLGWTELAPAGSTPRRVLPPSIGDERIADEFARSEIPGDDNQRLKRALVAWKELTDRGRGDSAAQEALTAIGYAREQLGQHGQAAQDYERAVKQYLQIRRTLETRATALRNGNFADAVIADRPGAFTRSEPLARAYASHDFQEHAKNYRDLQKLETELDSRQSGHPLTAQLAAVADKEIAAAQTEMARSIESQLENLSRYQQSAQYGLLRAYDQSDGPSVQRATRRE